MVPSDDLPEIAVQALLDGYDSQALRELAGESCSSHPADLRELFVAAIAEVGLPSTSPLEAAHRMKTRIARDVVGKRIGVREGAAEIVALYYQVEDLLPNSSGHVGEEFEIAKLIGLHYGYDDVSDAQSVAIVDEELRSECARIAKTPD